MQWEGISGAVLMGTVFPSCGAVMEKRTVKMVVTKKVVMELYVYVMKKQSSPARVQVYTCQIGFVLIYLCCVPMWFDHIYTTWILLLMFNTTEMILLIVFVPGKKLLIYFSNLFSDLQYKMDGFWDCLKLKLFYMIVYQTKYLDVGFNSTSESQYCLLFSIIGPRSKLIEIV